MINNIIWRTIPKEILNNILEYDGKIKYRNGKFINQICKDDERIPLLNSIPKKIFSNLYYDMGFTHTNVFFSNNKYFIVFIYNYKYNRMTHSIHYIINKIDNEITHMFCNELKYETFVLQ